MGGGGCFGGSGLGALVDAVELTMSHVAGGTSEVMEDGRGGAVAAAWRALQELCWCEEAEATAAASQWIEQLLGVALEQAAEGSAPLPLPAAAGPSGTTCGQPKACDRHPGVAAFTNVLAHIVGHCPSGPDVLLDALQLHISAARAWPAGNRPGGPTGSGGDATAAEFDMRSAQSAASAWVLVLQWLSHAAPRGSCRRALSRLSSIAASLLCWPPPSCKGDPLALALAGAAGTGEHVPSEGCPAPTMHRGPPQPAGQDPGDLDEAEGVCRPQGFLVGQQLLSQEAVSALGAESLAAIIGRLLLCQTSHSVASRGFTMRLELGAGPTLLAPASESSWDLQLSLTLFLIAVCSGDEDKCTTAGLEALTRQVVSSSQDVRQCFYLSVFLLEHLMEHQQGRYWQALKQLMAEAQAVEDERLLGNPFMQLQALFRN